MVKHVLKDGTTVDDITGRIVKVQDAKALYTLMLTISENPKRSRAYERGSE